MKHDFPMHGLGKLCGLFGKTRVSIYDYRKRLQQNELQDEIVLHYVKETRVTLPRLGACNLHIKIEPLLAVHNIKIRRDYLLDY